MRSRSKAPKKNKKRRKHDGRNTLPLGANNESKYLPFVEIPPIDAGKRESFGRAAMKVCLHSAISFMSTANSQ